MKKELMELVFILDRSGSMNGLEKDTIGGFNGMIQKQKREEGNAFVSTILFDDVSEVLYDRVDIQKIEPMNEEQYYVRGCTALLDAIGQAIHHMGNVHKYARKEDVPSKTLFVIITDGMENSSRRYSFGQVKEMILNQQEKYGWEFIFLGANMDAIEVAGQFGIHSTHAFNYECDQKGTKLNFDSISNAVSGIRKAKSKKEVEQAIWVGCAPIMNDYKKRHKK